MVTRLYDSLEALELFISWNRTEFISLKLGCMLHVLL